MYSQLFYVCILICMLSQTSLYVNGSILGDLLRAGGNVKYQLADVSDNVIDNIRGVFQPTLDNYGREGPGVGRRVDGNMGYNIGIPPVNPNDFYRSFAPSGSAEGRVGMDVSLPSASEALLASENDIRTRISNVQQEFPPLFRYFKY